MTVACDGSVWGAAGDTVTRLREGAFKDIPLSGYGVGSVVDVVRSAEGGVLALAAGSGGLGLKLVALTLDGNVEAVRDDPALTSVSASDARGMRVGVAGEVWVGWRTGLAVFDGDQWTISRAGTSEVPFDQVSSFFVDSTGVMWVPAEGKLWKRQMGERIVHLVRHGAAPQSYVSALALSNGPQRECPGSNATWYVGVRAFAPTSKPGLFFVRGSRIGPVRYPSGVPVEGDFDVLAGFPGGAWAAGSPVAFSGTTDSLLLRVEGETVTGQYHLPRGNDVVSLLADHDGQAWGGTDSGLVRFDGDEWRPYPLGNLPPLRVHALGTDKAGRLIAVMFDPVRFKSKIVRLDKTTGVFVVDSLDDYVVTPGLGVVSGTGNVWTFDSGSSGAHLYRIGEGGTLTEYPFPITDNFYGLGTDAEGRAWLSDKDGWHLSDDSVWSAPLFSGTEAPIAGGANLMMAGLSSLTIHGYDTVPPELEAVAAPAAVVGTRGIRTVIRGADLASKATQLEFAWALDGMARGAFGAGNTVIDVANLDDGPHVLHVWARDAALNEKQLDIGFLVDATPPQPLLFLRQVVSGDSVVIEGTVSDGRFESFSLSAQPVGSESCGGNGTVTLLGPNTEQVSGGPLGYWRTKDCDDGEYDVRLSVRDTLGLVGIASTRVIVDNRAPYVSETSGATVKSDQGGHIYTTNGEAHLYFAPHTVDGAILIRKAPASSDSVPATLEGWGAQRILAGYDLSWVGGELQKPATFDFCFAAACYAGAATPSAGAQLAVYRLEGGKAERIGGTVDFAKSRIYAVIRKPGRYALYADELTAVAGPNLSELSFTPRVFSPSGGYGNREVAIGFTLGRAGPVTVKVYSRSGQLVREVVSSQAMSAGVNLVRWDGRDRAGEIVKDGLYLVAVRGAGQEQVKPLAVVR